MVAYLSQVDDRAPGRGTPGFARRCRTWTPNGSRKPCDTDAVTLPTDGPVCETTYTSDAFPETLEGPSEGFRSAKRAPSRTRQTRWHTSMATTRARPGSFRSRLEELKVSIRSQARARGLRRVRLVAWLRRARLQRLETWCRRAALPRACACAGR